MVELAGWEKGKGVRMDGWVGRGVCSVIWNEFLSFCMIVSVL